MSISHSHRRTKRRWNPNIQRIRVMQNGAAHRLHVCTSCIRAGKVSKAVR
jgi:large subunit ribosomal protein L28